MFHVKQSEEYEKLIAYLNVHVIEEKYNNLVEYFDLLLNYNKTINLFSRKEPGVIIKHFLDALVGSFQLDFTDKIIDIGSGNGLPGLIIAIMYPKTRVKIYERKERKSVFLNIVKKKLNLNNVEIYNSNFQNPKHEGFSIIMKGVNPYDIKDVMMKYVRAGKVFYYSSGNMKSEIKKDYYVPVFNERHAIIQISENMLQDGKVWER